MARSSIRHRRRERQRNEVEPDDGALLSLFVRLIAAFIVIVLVAWWVL